MKFDLKLGRDEDLEYFHTVFLRSFGTEHNVFDYHLDNAMVRIQVAGSEEELLVTLGIFSVEKQGPHTSTTQLRPLADDRYLSFGPIQMIWGWNVSQAWGEMHVRAGDIEAAFDMIVAILRIVYQVNNTQESV